MKQRGNSDLLGEILNLELDLDLVCVHQFLSHQERKQQTHRQVTDSWVGRVVTRILQCVEDHPYVEARRALDAPIFLGSC